MASDRRVLVVGATGILRPAALHLAATGSTVVAVARGRVGLTALEAEGGRRIEVVPLDVTRQAEVVAASAPDRPLGRPLDGAIVYATRPPCAALLRVLAAVRGSVVRLLTSADADPAHGGGPDVGSLPWAVMPRTTGEIRLLLGWTGETDHPRWHTPDEVSTAALETWASGEDAVLGRIRPWQERPR